MTLPTWTRKAGNQAVLDRIGHARCDDGNEAGGLLSWAGSRRTQCDNDIKLAFNQFRGGFAEFDPGPASPNRRSMTIFCPSV